MISKNIFERSPTETQGKKVNTTFRYQPEENNPKINFNMQETLNEKDNLDHIENMFKGLSFKEQQEIMI